jgi:hypothetical protein
MALLIPPAPTIRAARGPPSSFRTAHSTLWGNRANPPLITMASVRSLATPDFLAGMDAIAVVRE